MNTLIQAVQHIQDAMDIVQDLVKSANNGDQIWFHLTEAASLLEMSDYVMREAEKCLSEGE